MVIYDWTDLSGPFPRTLWNLAKARDRLFQALDTMPLIHYLEVEEYFRRPMRKVKVKCNSFYIYSLQSSSKCVGKCIMQSFLAWNIRPKHVNIALILNILSNIGTSCKFIKRLAFSSLNWEKGESIENPHYYLFLKIFIYLFLERGEGREKERERNINVCLPLMWPPLGTWPTTQACALIRHRTSDPLIHSPCSIHWATAARARKFCLS